MGARRMNAVGRPLQRVLVANRGEIAVRVMRACRMQGIETVGVASEADRLSPHALLADQVVELPGTSPAESYLRIDRIVDAARSTRCDAVHPGYGFLAENADFAQAVLDAGLVFVGPSPRVIEEMGLKTKARDRMRAAGVPVVPGAQLEAKADDGVWRKAAREVGFPLLVKAAAGGGGKGMRRVDREADLPAAIGAARREAASAFGDATVYLERLLDHPRHVEVQILGDAHGHFVHLGERDCSVQRRHQKIIEESPAPDLPDATRERMWEAAVQAARAVEYVGAGTVEMLLDASGEFYFLEMNTRLQVEHPITELVTGIDLVAAQLRVAAGERLGFESVTRPLGHAIEARVYAEDPAQGFLPQTGLVHVFEPPSGPGIRVDAGVEAGTEVTLHYDPLIAKVCAWGEHRDQARRRLRDALADTVLLGVTTNLEYLQAILGHEAFAAGGVNTGLLDEHFPHWKKAPATDAHVVAAVAALGTSLPGLVTDGAARSRTPGPWITLGPWRLTGGSR